jgi:putative restriction endonuclease
VRVFGEIKGVEVGTEFASRAELAASGIHRPTQAGVSGSEFSGADSIVVSGGYDDDEDYGDYLIYGGQVSANPNTREQIADAELSRGNLALVVSYNRGLPVRVTRGLGSGKHTYRYDGLYLVERWWPDRGKSGFRVYRFALRKIDDKPISTPIGELPLPASNQQASRVKSYTTRIVRDTLVAEAVKQAHNHACQVCNTRLERPGGPYAEGAHIVPLGRPHNGPDVAENILCLCPNCRLLFDGWAFTIEDDGSLTGALSGQIREDELHAVSREYLAYHRRLFREVNHDRKAWVNTVNHSKGSPG